jgi:hypothetical protein
MKAYSIRTEALLLIVISLLSLLLLPALIYGVGTQLFGPYRTGFAGMYAASFKGLLQLHPSAWIMVLAPAVAVLLIRLVLRLTPGSAAETQASTTPTRHEPRLGS